MIVMFSEVLHVADNHHSLTLSTENKMFVFHIFQACQLTLSYNNERGLLMSHVHTFHFN